MALQISFTGILRPREDVRDIAKMIIEKMNREGETGKEVNGEGFIGIHLRTESDAISTWPNFTTQSTTYLSLIPSLPITSPIKVLYIASGNTTQTDLFTTLAHSLYPSLIIHTKHSLLSSITTTNLSHNDRQSKDNRANPTKQNDVELSLADLTFDQLALLDYMIVLRSTYFLGVSPSSFSISVAVRRHVLLFSSSSHRKDNDGNDIHHDTPPFQKPSDGKSTLIGSFQDYWDDWLWIYDTMWP